MNDDSQLPVGLTEKNDASPHSNRESAVDGLRAFAVMGVIWAHQWSFGFDAVSLRLGVVDFHKILSVGGTGVDLFFVISGFCMYIAYLGNPIHRSAGIVRLLTRRLYRISPAYYFAVVVFAVVLGVTDVWSILMHLLFLQTLAPGVNELAAPFWSVCTEMQFYVVLPVFLVLGERRVVSVALMMLMASVVLAFILKCTSTELYDYLQKQIPVRLSEFCFGVLAGVWMRKSVGKAKPGFNKYLQLLASILLICCGRLMLTSWVVDNESEYVRVLESLGRPVLAGGYAVLLVYVILVDGLLKRLLESKPVTYIGKISYSMYLWHWIPCLWLADLFRSSFGAGPIEFWLCFVLAVIVLLLISSVSYVMLEAPYFWLRNRSIKLSGQ